MTGSIEVRERPGDRLRCPYCHDDLASPDGAARCAPCGAAHHATCAVEAGACGACGQALALAEVSVSERPCAFQHDCGGNAVVGDSLCATHRREVSLGARDLRSVRDEALALVSSLDRIGRAMALGGSAVGFVLLINLLRLVPALRDSGYPLRVACALPIVLALAALSGWLLRKVGRVRTLIESVPDDVLAPRPGTVRVSTPAWVVKDRPPTA
ncbi:MAG: hypothetical protein M9894_37600 [Planctomycetes bacterium]|nr:hypothetical protein [Planctomycetota bacterium]